MRRTFTLPRSVDDGLTYDGWTEITLDGGSGPERYRIGIERAIRDYRYRGIPLRDYMGIYWTLTDDTYGRTVQCGLEEGRDRLARAAPGSVGIHEDLAGFLLLGLQGLVHRHPFNFLGLGGCCRQDKKQAE